MTTELKLPELAESMMSATVTAWLRQPGERVAQGDPVVEVDTDKTTVEIEAPVSGVLREVMVPEGTEEVEVGTVLALIDEGADQDTEPPAEALAQVASEATDPAGVVATEPTRPTVVTREAVETREIPAADDANATPLARRMAAVADIDLSHVDGTGPDGRIRKVDVDRLFGGDSSERADRAETPAASTGYADHPLSTVRRVTAKRLTHAKQTVPHFYLSTQCEMTGVIDARARYNDGSTDHITLTDVVVRAIALALGRVPAANSAWHDEGVRVFTHADIAVAVNTSSGLYTPVVKGADTKTLATIARELRHLTDRARQGQLTPDEYSGGSFTVSNLGMYDVSSLYAIVNPPQSCVLGVGAVSATPVVRDGAVVIGQVATFTLSADHRVLDGATGGELLRELKGLLQTPLLLFD